MPLEGRAPLNLLMRKVKKDPALEVEEWQIKDYRKLSSHEIFRELKGLSIPLNEHSFKESAALFDDPEELTKSFDSKVQEHAYPYLFELWRRYLPERETLSIFADEIDYLIDLYEEGILEVDEKLQDILFELSNLLDGYVDLGYQPKLLFKKVLGYISVDLEQFLYGYIRGLIERDHETLASELLECFYPYVQKGVWFEFLRMAELAKGPSELGASIMARFLEELKERPILNLYFDLLRYLIKEGHNELFIKESGEVLSLIKKEEEFKEMLVILSQFYCLNDVASKEKKIQDLMVTRKGKPSASEKEEVKKLLVL